MRKAAADFRKKLKEEDQAKPKEDTGVRLPENLYMLFRVIFLLRGLCSSLRQRVPYLMILASHAQLALIQSVEPRHRLVL